MAALLAACAAPAAAPTATPLPPTPTPIPPTPTPSPLDLAKAYESAWNSYEPDALAALFAKPFTFNSYPVEDFNAWYRGWPNGMMMGSGGKIEVHDCQISSDTVTCTMAYDSDCFDTAYIEDWTVRDGKITELVWRVTPEEASKWDRYESLMNKWAAEQNPPQLAAYKQETAKGLYDYDWGVAFAALCKEYEAAMQAKANDPTAVVQAWFAAINDSDLDAAMALMTPDAVIPGTGAPNRPARNVVDWWIDMQSHFDAPDCQQADDRLVCDFMMTEHGCTVASGYTVGDSMRYTFDMQDGKIHRLDKVSIASVGNDVSSYYKWLEEEMAWANTHHAEELAGIDWDGFSTGGGDIVVKLCQEYAETLK
jgi:ketosteroid isomerase-like protein